MASPPAPRAARAPSDVRSRIAHLYRRAGFGARPDELDAAADAGYEATAERLIVGLTSPDPAADAVARPTFASPTRAVAGDQAARQAQRQQRRLEEADRVRWWLDRMIVAANPLREKLTLFWHGHFATSIEKVKLPQLMYDQNELLRTRGAGSFEALTQAVAKDPAMLIWLDSNSNHRGSPNENFARELMELFTLGIGNYTEQDVKEGARCFTGWRVDRRSGRFAFAARDHDDGVKTFLGQQGNFGGEDVVRIVCHHPASARWVASRVWSHFARPAAPDDPVVAELASGYARDLDVTALLRAVLLHAEFTSPATRTGLVKTPIEYVVGTLRALGLRGADVGSEHLAASLQRLGQLPFAPPSVGGWPQNGYWLTTASSLERARFATAVAKRADLSALHAIAPPDRPVHVAHLLSIDGWSPRTASALARVSDDPASLVALALVAPEYVLA